jgi:altronate hydrolase
VKAVLLISARDNVATALQPLQAGQVIDAGTARVTVTETIAPGHKIALRDLAVGDAVIKYGSPIGTASVAIVAGAHVHTHNVASSRGRGDIDPAANDLQPRLAEPPDEAATRTTGTPTRVINK